MTGTLPNESEAQEADGVSIWSGGAAVLDSCRIRDNARAGLHVDSDSTELASLLPMVVTVRWGASSVLSAPFVVVNR